MNASHTPPSAWDEYAMREATRLWNRLALRLPQSQAMLHVALIDAIWFATTGLQTPEPKPPKGYTAEELDQDSPFNQWMRE